MSRVGAATVREDAKEIFEPSGDQVGSMSSWFVIGMWIIAVGTHNPDPVAVIRKHDPFAVGESSGA